MALTEEEVIQILKLVEESSFDEFYLETGDLKLVVKKGGAATAATEADSISVIPAAAQSVPAGKADYHGDESVTNKRSEPAPTAELNGLVPIKAPMLGVAYRRPAPQSPPYVEVGSYVKKTDTVCLIEIMKTFNAVEAGVSGHIAEVLFDESIMVEYGQPLFLVKPEPEPL